MKLIVGLLAIFIVNISIAQDKTKFIEFKTEMKVVPVSKIAKIGKISVFIISADWCSPCVGLKRRLQDTLFSKNVDFYYIEIANKKMKDFSKTKEFRFWSKVEGLEGFPYIYITSQSSNIISKFSTGDGNTYLRIVETIKDLTKDTEDFSENMIFKNFGAFNHKHLKGEVPFSQIEHTDSLKR